MLQSEIGGISPVSISLSGIAARASSSARNFGVSGSELPLLIVLPLMGLRLPRTDDFSGSIFILGPSVNDIEDYDSIRAGRAQSPPPFLIGIRIGDRDAQRITEGTFGKFKADLVLLKVALRLFGIPRPAHRTSVYTVSYLQS